MGVRHIKKIKVPKKAHTIKYNPDINPYHEVREWAMGLELQFYDGDNYYVPLTENDLLRLRRAVNRALKIVKNPKKHETYKTL